MSKPKTKYYKQYWDLWERLRRHPDYLKLCDDVRFNEAGFVDPGYLTGTFPNVGYDKKAADEYLSICKRASQLTIPHLKISGIYIILDPRRDWSEDPILHLLGVEPPIVTVKHPKTGEKPHRGRFSVDGRHEVVNPAQYIEDNKYITVQIDLSQQDKYIFEALKWHINYFRPFLRQTGKDSVGDLSKRRHFQKREEYYHIWDERKIRKPFSMIARQMGISVDTVRKQFYKGFELITGEQYHKDIWKNIIRETLEQRVKGSNGKYDKDVWKELLDFEETKQKDTLIEAKPSEAGKTVYVEDWDSKCADLEARLLYRDIHNICQKCGDTACYKAMESALAEDDFSSWNACPDIYTFLKSKN